MSNDDDFVFDRNNQSDQPQDQIDSTFRPLQAAEFVVNRMTHSSANELDKIKSRVFAKLLSVQDIRDDVNHFRPETILNDLDLIDQDMLTVGKIENKILTIDLLPFHLEINLRQVIVSAIQKNAPRIIKLLLDNNFDLYSIEPKIMMMCVATKQYDLLTDLISKHVPVHTEDYKCIYLLAAQGKLDLINLIIEQYRPLNLPSIIMKICIQAIINKHLHILEYFLTSEAFVSSPDQMFHLFVNGIRYGADLDTVKFFIKSGINLRQNNYEVVYVAQENDRKDLIQYFYALDNTVANLMTDQQKIIYGLTQIRHQKQYIGTDACCNISYDDINEGDTYYQCSEKLHRFREDAWLSWTKNKSNWLCPQCLSTVDHVAYLNLI